VMICGGVNGRVMMEVCEWVVVEVANHVVLVLAQELRRQVDGPTRDQVSGLSKWAPRHLNLMQVGQLDRIHKFVTVG